MAAAEAAAAKAVTAAEDDHILFEGRNALNDIYSWLQGDFHAHPDLEYLEQRHLLDDDNDVLPDGDQRHLLDGDQRQLHDGDQRDLPDGAQRHLRDGDHRDLLDRDQRHPRGGDQEEMWDDAPTNTSYTEGVGGGITFVAGVASDAQINAANAASNSDDDDDGEGVATADWAQAVCNRMPPGMRLMIEHQPRPRTAPSR
eukprot:6069927-Prymnesium_polylepis.1